MSENNSAYTSSPSQVTLKPHIPPGSTISASERLREDKRHPVLIFGSSMSGKSTMIMSLINALEKSGRAGGASISASFGRSFYARRDPKVEVQMRYAQDFFEKSSHAFIVGHEALQTTQVDMPFFIPIDLIVDGKTDDVVKIAILDGRGEWYIPSDDPLGNMYRDLNEDIVDVLVNYERALSVICVAPFSISDNNLLDTQHSDAGLLGALVKYEESRAIGSRQLDSLLFLLSKWDQFADPLHDERFGVVSSRDVIKQLEERYPRSWDRFRSLPLGAEDWGRRCFMQYSSCTFVKGKPRILDHLLEKHIRYPRTVLNWIYGNARRYQESQGSVVETFSLVLFPDVLPLDANLIPVSEKLLRWITR